MFHRAIQVLRSRMRGRKKVVEKTIYWEFRNYMHGEAVHRWWTVVAAICCALIGMLVAGVFFPKSTNWYDFLVFIVIYGGLAGVAVYVVYIYFTRNFEYFQREEMLVQKGVEWLQGKRVKDEDLEIINARAEIGAGIAQTQVILPGILVSIVVSAILSVLGTYLVTLLFAQQLRPLLTDEYLHIGAPLALVGFVWFLLVPMQLGEDILRGNTDAVIRATVAEYRHRFKRTGSSYSLPRAFLPTPQTDPSLRSRHRSKSSKRYR